MLDEGFICTSVYSATSLCEIKWADCGTAVTHLFTNVVYYIVKIQIRILALKVEN